MPPDPWIVRSFVRFYRLLVGLYPASFRRSFGDDMIRLFRDESLNLYRESGAMGLLGYGASCSVDFLESLVFEHWESVMTNGNRFKQRVYSRLLPACWLALAALSLGFSIASHRDSVGLFSIGNDTSLRFVNGVMEFRRIYARSIEAPIPRDDYHATAVGHGWINPPEPSRPVFAYSSGHVLGIGGKGIDGHMAATVTPAEYGLLRVPLWVLLLPLLVWSVLIVMRKPRGQTAVEIVA